NSTDQTIVLSRHSQMASHIDPQWQALISINYQRGRIIIGHLVPLEATDPTATDPTHRVPLCNRVTPFTNFETRQNAFTFAILHIKPLKVRSPSVLSRP